jgi:hypothetical protein
VVDVELHAPGGEVLGRFESLYRDGDGWVGFLLTHEVPQQVQLVWVDGQPIIIELAQGWQGEWTVPVVVVEDSEWMHVGGPWKPTNPEQGEQP